MAVFRARLIDPNRNPGMGIELGEQVTTIQAGPVNDSQMQATTQHQIAVVERARAVGGLMISGSSRRSSGRPGNGAPVVIYPRALPEPTRLPIDTHLLEQMIDNEPHILDGK